MHLNGFVDVISKAFLDVIIQPGQYPDEREALHTMLDHFHPDDPGKYIITADRGYESYDLLFHCELKHLNYVFRVKAPSSSKSLLYFHSKKPEFLKQEIYANLFLYNFGIFLANEAVEENRKKKLNSNNKYNYEINFSLALRTARKFFIRRDSHKPVNIIKLMLKYVHVVKTEFRQFARPLRRIGAIHFGYR